jgi:hypothetical protein
MCSNSADISFACKLWQVFRAVITGAVEGLKAIMGDAVAIVMDAIDTHIECWFLQVLQLDTRTLSWRLWKSMLSDCYAGKN